MEGNEALPTMEDTRLPGQPGADRTDHAAAAAPGAPEDRLAGGGHGEARIGAIVLAAGRGRRMGLPKLRLVWGGKSFFEIILGRLDDGGIAPVAAVIAAAEEAWARPLAGHARLVINHLPEAGMLLSVRLGVAALGECAALLIVPVDHPQVRPESYARLHESARQHPGMIIKPVCQGRPGHPVVIPRSLYPALLTAAPDSSLREVLRRSACPTHYEEVDDPGIHANINEAFDLP